MKRLLALCALALCTAGCFSPEKPICSYVCADTAPKCPDDYECRSDGYCHKIGTSDACPFSDAAMPADLSATAPPDMTSAGDLASTD